MITTEDRVRAAARAAAATVPPDSAPPLRLPADPGRRPGLLARVRAMTPLAAAISVIAAIAAAMAIAHSIGSHQAGPRGGPAVSGAAALRSIPPYYAALVGPEGMPHPAIIRATATGRVLATVTPPRPYHGFTFISGAADDRTFVLAAQRWWPIARGQRGQAAEIKNGATPVAFFRLRFDPVTRTAHLTALRTVGQMTATDLSGIALSPDGSRLALVVRPAEIKVITLATGAAREWIWPGTTGLSAPPVASTWVGNAKPAGAPLSWTADGRTLAFQLWTRSGGITEVRLLDTTGPGTNLRAARSSVAFIGLGKLKYGPYGNTIITPDGSRIVTVANRPGAPLAKVIEYSARTGKPVSSLGRGSAIQEMPWDVLWANRDGSTVIVSAALPGDPAHSGVAVLRHGQTTPLPWAPANTANVAW
jgi:hypothetical protein